MANTWQGEFPIENVAAESLTLTLAWAGPAQAKRILGTKGADRIVGTAKGDVIKSRGGNDRIRGRGGRDRLFGGRGMARIARTARTKVSNDKAAN